MAGRPKKDTPKPGRRLLPREQLMELLEEELTELIETLREAMKAKKRVRQNVRCPHGEIFRGEFTVRDFGTILKTAEFVLDRIYGRPGTEQAEGGGGGGFVMVNVVKLVDADGEETLPWLAERGLLAKPLADVEEAWAVAHTTPPEAAARLRELDEAGE